MNTRLDDHMVEAALGDLDQAHTHLDDATVAALRMADVLTGERPSITPEFHEELAQHFDQGQILELGSALAVASGWQRFIEAFGIRPDHWTPGDELPERPGS